MVDPLLGLPMPCIDPPSRRTAPTPTPAAKAAASAWRRVRPRRTERSIAATFSRLGATLMPTIQSPETPHDISRM